MLGWQQDLFQDTHSPTLSGIYSHRCFRRRTAAAVADHALGRSRGGFGTKLHILCDAKGHPLHFELSAGNVHDSRKLESVLDGADEALYLDSGEVVPWPLALAGDKGYRANYIDQALLDLGITPKQVE